ncbi:glycosyltransferase family 4 protein [Flavobacterium anhuiense]|uniref:glycosyltransferase family 4 protein n=1 Tax=Flavobacterium anhuiense TaxID=459526 RepID=UPI002025EF35|nr:glycosyltransferase family 4 protein [Flavobacterium anhuiense]URM37355.1 glycosyltransferase family 4 protein [Flavobacterium anhuiense]
MIFNFFKKHLNKRLKAFLIKRYNSLKDCIHIFKSKIFFFKGNFQKDLIIYDDSFPFLISGFRYEEFTELLKAFENSSIIMNHGGYAISNDYQNRVEDYKIKHNDLKDKLSFNKGRININTKLFYCVFQGNIGLNLPWLELNKIPFVFTLYPGGGFQMGNAGQNKVLSRVLSSPQFRRVIVTQSCTREYLLKNNLCSPEKISYIFGCVVPQISLEKDLTQKKYYLKGKKTFDVCFCAAKYMEFGIDKGYDVFIESALSLANNFDFIRFHVIGGFNKDEIDVTKLEEKITFYGYQNFEDLSRLYLNMDVIVSPNKPFVLGNGYFDGFPLGTVVEAVFNGVVALATDELQQNTEFLDGEEIIIIKSSPQSIVTEIIKFINSPEKLYFIAERGRERFIEVYSYESQMEPRIDLLKQEILSLSN